MEQGFGPEASVRRARGRCRSGRLVALVASLGVAVLVAIAWRLFARDDARPSSSSGAPAGTATSIGESTSERSAVPLDVAANPPNRSAATRAEQLSPSEDDDNDEEVNGAMVVTPHAVWRLRTVTRDGRSPVAFVDVTGNGFVRRGRHAGFLLGMVATTDANGRCTVCVEPRKPVQLHFEPMVATCRPCDVELPPLANHETREQIVELETCAPAANFVRVVAHGGAPIPGATIATQLDARHASIHCDAPSATSDASGVAQLPLVTAPGQLVEVSATGFASATLLLHRGLHERAARPRVVELDRCARLFGAVTDARFRPIENADVLVTWSGEQERRGAELDDFGRYELDDLPPNVKLHVAARVADSRESFDVDVTLAPGESRALDLHVPDAVSLRGRVLLPDGRPCGDAIVRLIRPRPADLVLKPLIAEDDGTFETAEVWPGDWWIVVHGHERSMAATALAHVDARSARTPVELRLEPLATLRGHVVRADGAPIDHDVVTLERPFASPAHFARSPVVSVAAEPIEPPRDGSAFEFARLEPGPLELIVELADVRESRPEWSFDSVPRGDVELRLPSEPRIVVMLDDPDPDGARVVAVRRGSGEEVVARADLRETRRGLFDLQPLVAGTWDVVATDAAGRIAVATDVTLAASEQRTVPLQPAPGAWAIVHVAPRTDARRRAEARGSSDLVRARVGELVVASAVLSDSDTDGGLLELLVPAGQVNFELVRAGTVVARAEQSFVAGAAAEVELAPR